MSTDSTEMQNLIKKLKDRPFWIWVKERHDGFQKPNSEFYGRCCFNHAIPAGPPRKNGIPQPFWTYQGEIYRALMVPHYLNARSPTLKEQEEFRTKKLNLEELTLSKDHSIRAEYDKFLKYKEETLIHPFKNKHLWIKKATGLGITEFMLRFMAWLCSRNDDYKGSHMCIVCGPRLEIAIENCNRIRKLFEPGGITLGGSSTSMKINGVTITAYPSNHLDSMRGLDNVSFILLDEADFFPKHEQENARIISERYIQKSNPYIVMVSTPNRPDGLFASIEKEPFDTCIYKKLFSL
jgi:hypothetical protein